MQRTNGYANVIKHMSVVTVLNGILLILLFVFNIALSVRNEELLTKMQALIPHLNTKNMVIIGVVFATILNIVINYNVLKVICQLSVDIFEPRQVAFMYLMSSVLSSCVLYVLGDTDVFDYVSNSVFGNVVYIGLIYLFTNTFVIREKKRALIATSSIVKLNVLLGIYGFLNVWVALMGENGIV